MSVLFALAIAMIAGSLAHSPALAHGGHAHGAAPTLRAPAVPPMVNAAAPAELAAPATSSAAHVSSGSDDQLFEQISALLAEPEPEAPAAVAEGLGKDVNGPCEGHCCTPAGSGCCSFVGPASQHVSACPLAIDAGSHRTGERLADGLEPDSLLRPPKSFV